MSSRYLKVEKEAMQLARKAVELDAPRRLTWILRCHKDADVVERVLLLVQAFDEEDDSLGISVGLPESTSAAEQALPEFVDRFRVVDLLGAGAFSRVYRAVDELSGEEVALKVLHMRDQEPEMARRFEREIQVLQALDHPSIASLVDAGETSSELGVTRWIAMELVEGESFREALSREEPRKVVAAMVLVAEAIDHAHGKGVVHRDVKPSNVLVDTTGIPKVVDFGVAALRDRPELSRLTQTGQVIGTIAYMSPEQVAGEAPTDRSDQFALAAMLFEKLTGSLPHSDGKDGLLGLFSIASWDGRMDPRLLRSLDASLGVVLGRALDPDPALRFPSTRAFADELRRWVSGKPIRTVRPTAWRTARRFVSRNRAPVAVAAAIVALLGTALGVTRQALKTAGLQSERAVAVGDLARLSVLLDQEAELWPQSEEAVPRLASWLQSADAIMARRSATGEWIDSAAELDRWEADLAELEPKISRVRARKERAETLTKRTVNELEEPWTQATERVESDVRFAGWTLTPQTGLIPLGPDPDSDLEEFAVADWGSLPTRDPDTGELLLEDDFTPVLVLIPGGPTRFGCPQIDADEQFLASGRPLFFNEATFGIREVRLDPFFIGKYEVTQAQWLKITGENPSEWKAGENNYGLLMTGRHPVEIVSYEDCMEASRRIGCTLPTEAQWQHAASPVDRGMYWWPESRIWTSAPENLISESLGDRFEACWPPDEFQQHAPVGSFQPNPMGLHDVLGNVSERCLDPFKVAVLEDPTIAMREGDGLVLADGGGDFAVRGGSFHANFQNPHLPLRLGPTSHVRWGTIGMRFARAVHRP